MVKYMYKAIYLSFLLFLATAEEAFANSNTAQNTQVKQADTSKEIQKYQDIITQGGEKEEIWLAKFKLGETYEAMDQWDKAHDYYFEAYNYNPARAEPLEKLATHYRKHNQFDLAYQFARLGKKIPRPSEQSLFISDPVYDYRFDEELAIVAYYTPFRGEGYDAIERLMRNKKAPSDVKQLAENNLRFYVQKLENTHLQSLQITPPLLRQSSTTRYNPTNPSILKTEDGYVIICRCVNYRIENGKIVGMLDPKPYERFSFKTRNVLLNYDKDFTLLSQKEIIDNLSESMKLPPRSAIEGLEDSRIFKYDNALWASATVWDMNEQHLTSIGLYRLAPVTLSQTQVPIEYFIPLQGPNPTRYEKNWLPFVKEGKIHEIYSYDPLLIYCIDPSTGTCEQVVCRSQKYDYTSFRGSAGPIPFGDEGYLVVVHHASTDDGRYYFHRFLQLDKDFNITHLSKPFTYKNCRVEFCAGMTVDHSGKTLIMSVGIEDREAILAFIDLAAVRSLLLPMNDLY